MRGDRSRNTGIYIKKHEATFEKSFENRILKYYEVAKVVFTFKTLLTKKKFV